MTHGIHYDHMVISGGLFMKTFTAVEAKSHFSALLDEVEAGEEIVVTRRGKIVARLVPDHPRTAADAFRDIWAAKDEIDLEEPEDLPPEDDIEPLDD
jgi:prevent-host-death family protein